MPNSVQIPGPTSDSSRQPHDDTFEILRKIGKSHLQAIALEPNFAWNDNLFPYSEDQLPKDENGSLDYVTDFIKEQNKVLSERFHLPEIIQSLTRRSDQELPPHIQTNHIGDVYHLEDRLGDGRYGEVHKVRLQAIDNLEGFRSSEVFAMKRIRKPAPRQSISGPARCTVSEFETELHHLSRSRHHHIINLRASFTDDAHFGFIVSPVAPYSLQELLSQYVRDNHISEHMDVRKALSRSFGCLLEAVGYLHNSLHIRHRDLKPRNILMHNQRVLICDLGSAYDFEDRKESTDNKRPPGTRKYKAPEVLESRESSEPKKHNTKVDIFSLGCVFLEIHTVLCDQTLDQMSKFLTGKETTRFEGERGDWTYAMSLERIGRWLDKIAGPDGLGEGLTSVIRSMVWLQPYVLSAQKLSADLNLQLCRNHRERKSAEELFQAVRTKYSRYIGNCCRDNRPYKKITPPMPIRTVPPSPQTRTPMHFSVRRPITLCRIGRRKPTSGFPKAANYGEHIFFADHCQEGELEIQQVRRSDVWASTRSIIVTLRQSPHAVETQC